MIVFKNKEHLFTFLSKCDNMFVIKEKMFVFWPSNGRIEYKGGTFRWRHSRIVNEKYSHI
jgi:hypothetical protein